MVQIVNAQPAMSMAEAGGRGFESGFNASLNQRIQDQQEQKKLAMQEAYNTKTNASLSKAFGYPQLGEMLGSAPPEITSKLLSTFYENGISEKSLMDQIKIATGGQSGQIHPNAQGPQQPVQGGEFKQPVQKNNLNQQVIGQNLGFQGSNQAPYLNPQQVSAQQQSSLANITPQGSQQPSVQPPAQIHEQEKQQALADLNESLSRPGANNTSRKSALTAYNTRINQIESSRKGDIAERTANLGQVKQSYKERQDTINRAEKYTDPINTQMEKIDSEIEKRKNDLMLQKDAIKRGNFGPGSLDHILSLIGLDASVSKEASQFKGAIKGNVVDTIHGVTGQKNVYLEQMMVGAAGELGATHQGNLILADGAISRLKIDEMKVNNWEEIRDKYLKDPEYGYVPIQAVSEWKKMNKEGGKIISKELVKNIQEDREYGMSRQDLMKLEKNPEPTPLTEERSKAIVQRAISSLSKALGHEPSKDEVLKYSRQLIKDYNFIMPEE